MQESHRALACRLFRCSRGAVSESNVIGLHSRLGLQSPSLARKLPMPGKCIDARLGGGGQRSFSKTRPTTHPFPITLRVFFPDSKSLANLKFLTTIPELQRTNPWRIGDLFVYFP